jgi:hypothetical protein
MTSAKALAITRVATDFPKGGRIGALDDGFIGATAVRETTLVHVPQLFQRFERLFGEL